MTAADVHALGQWPHLLQRLGIAAHFLQNRHGPCPACGGTDRFRFDNRDGRGGFFCNACGAGDGFQLLQRVHGWTFAEALREVVHALGGSPPPPPPPRPRAPDAPPPVHPTQRVHDILQGGCPVDRCGDAVAYLVRRGLWPLPPATTLRAHVAVPYWDETGDARRCVGRYPALVAPVRDRDGALVTAHVTYLEHGHKLSRRVPRKLLSRLEGAQGCAAQLLPVADGMIGVAEGIETALAAARLHHMPVWAALNTSLLQRFVPPASVTNLVVFADRDVPGLEAASRLLERLQRRVAVELRVPRAPFGDWADALLATLDAREPGADDCPPATPAWWNPPPQRSPKNSPRK